MTVLAYELCLALRRIARRPTQSALLLVTLTASLTLALVGWSLFHTMFLQQPAFDSEGTLYRIGVTGEVTQGRVVPLSRQDIEAWKTGQTVFTDFAAVALYQSTFVTTDLGDERFLGANVSTDVLRMVGARPLLGRLFTPEEDRAGCVPVLLLSEKMWRTRFGASLDVINRTVLVDGVTATIVGVMPASFVFPNAQDLWQPLGFNPHEQSPAAPVFDVVARLKPGIPVERAMDDLRILAKRSGPESVITRFNLQPVGTPFREYYLHADMSRSAIIVFALSLVFVLVSCINAANLVMIDFFGRRSEIATALALGASRAAAVRGLAFQILVIATVAAAIAFVGLLAVGPYVHAAMSRITTPYWLLFTLQPHHAWMAAALALGSVAGAMLVPLGYIGLVNVEHLMRSESGATRSTGRGWWRRSLLVGQIALLTVLAVAAGLLLRSTQHVRPGQWGFDATSIFSSKTSTPQSAFPTPAVRLAVHQRLLEEIERIPSVTAAGLMTNPVGFSHSADVRYGRSVDEVSEGGSAGRAVWSLVTPNLFAVLNVPFLEGETFLQNPLPPAPDRIPGAVITAGIAQRLWPGEAAVGRQFYARFNPDPKQAPLALVVRGVLRNFQAAGPKAVLNDGIYGQIEGGMFVASFLYVRGKQGLPPFDELRAAAGRVDPRMAIYFPNQLKRVIDTELSSVHLTTQLTSAYAVAAVLLCLVGIYSITISQVLQRHREFGIRMALGLEPRRLWLQFARGHLLSAGVGLVLGLVGAAAVARVLSTLLFGVDPHDPATFILVAVAILSVSIIACLPSLFRLKRVNPADCLRSV